ncbi:hypothetical protein L211DRAFT_232284 [Terfezia boudieri ATCC MYA-4762]|uniref:Uncharacterized protein n=1 Tax=Terfezia boudieri ATCC MYA-4762 TaxID=1051890 RepID=A0A3N4LLE1_9PEZI|nr:hypothetical protein L211DRAFT_232284 [Terfezia boudieri ATCC MYA-4762]
MAPLWRWVMLYLSCVNECLVWIMETPFLAGDAYMVLMMAACGSDVICAMMLPPLYVAVGLLIKLQLPAASKGLHCFIKLHHICLMSPSCGAPSSDVSIQKCARSQRLIHQLRRLQGILYTIPAYMRCG